MKIRTIAWLLLAGLVTLGSGLAQQTQTTTLGPVKTPLVIFKQQTCASIAGVANLTLMCYDISGTVEVNINNTGWVALSSSACSNCVVTDGSGNATIAGDFTALELILSGLGPLDVVTPCNTVSAPPGGFGLFGMGVGCVPVIYPSTLSAVTPLAYQDGFGNVYQNANTATALAATPAQCSGHYATGIAANGTANCDTSTYVLTPTITDPGATASYLSMFGTTTQIQAHINGGTAVTLLRKDTAFATYTCPISDATGATFGPRFCNWTLPVGITVVAYDLAIDNTATCSAYPVIQVWDGTAAAEVGSYSITLNGSTSIYTQVTGSALVTAGHQLGMKVTTVGTCGTAPHGAVAVITYQIT